MNTITRLLLAATLTLPFAACKKQEEAAPAAAVQAPVAAPTTEDDLAWQEYVTDVVKRNLGEDSSTPYVYYLPGESSADFAGGYDRLLEQVEAGVARGGVEGTVLAFASPASAKLADLIVEAFSRADSGSMKGVKVLHIGQQADSARAKAAVEPSGATYQFVEAK